MKRIFSIIMALLMLVTAMTGCGRPKEIEELIASVESDINTIMLDASPMHDAGSIDTELYMEIIDIKNEFTEVKNLYETTDGDRDEEILATLNECRETVNELKSRIDEIKTSVNEKLSKSAEELKNIAQQLSPYVQEGVGKGYLDQSRADEFNELVTRLDGIISSADNGGDLSEELNTIRETFAVMASQCAAPNNIIDALTGITSDITQAAAAETATETLSQAQGETVQQEESVPQADLQGLIDNFSLLQNEASQKFDKGEIDEDSYMTLIQAGTTLALLKEEVEKNGQSDAVNKRIADCQEQIKNIAESMGSELAGKF